MTRAGLWVLVFACLAAEMASIRQAPGAHGALLAKLLMCLPGQGGAPRNEACATFRLCRKLGLHAEADYIAGPAR